MTRETAGWEDISERLHKALEGLRKDVTRVEMWATALASFSQPVPDYRPDPKYELGQPVETGPLAQNNGKIPPGKERRKPPK
jgi:hypothetical protein